MIKMSLKNFIEGAGMILSIPASAGAVFYLGGALVMGSLNPFEWSEIEEQRKVKFEAREERLSRLDELGNKILRKAEMRDGQPGLSFLDRAHLLRDLGMETCRLQEKDRLRFYTIDFTKPVLHLKAGPYARDISEEKAKAYLGGE